MTLTMTPGSVSPSRHPDCVPRWATQRSPERETFGPAISAVADALGLPLMPWQRLVADIGGELDPTTGLPAYREVVVTVPRQSGKTSLVLAWEIQRARGWGSAQRIAYSAQTGNDARKKLIEDQAPLLLPRLKKLGIRRVLRGTGAEAVEFANGSRIVLLYSAAGSGHGKTIDLGIKDELFADYDDRRDQSLVPAMATKPAAQILTTSTMGTDDSAPLNRAVERGRAAVESDTRSGIAYFEWSASLDDDPDDPDTWYRCMPALGHTITEGVVAHARATLTDGEFRRAFLNQQTRADDRVLPAVEWYSVCSETVGPEGPMVFGLDVNPDRSAGAIVAAAGGAMPTAELVDYHPGTGWLADRARELSQKFDRPRFVIDAAGPAASLIPELADLDVHPVTARELVAACGQFYDAVMGAKVRIRRSVELDAAAAGAARRTIGDAWAWTRKSASTDISPLVALTLALWAHSQTAAPSVTAEYLSMEELLRG